MYDRVFKTTKYVAELGLNPYWSIKSMKARFLGSLQSFLSLATLVKSPWIYLSELKYLTAIDPCICSHNLMVLDLVSFQRMGQRAGNFREETQTH